jgi:hypothetical protein
LSKRLVSPTLSEQTAFGAELGLALGNNNFELSHRAMRPGSRMAAAGQPHCPSSCGAACPRRHWDRRTRYRQSYGDCRNDASSAPL